MEIIVGTYEQLALGYRLVKTKNGFELNLSFTNHTHSGSIKAVASSANLLLATGSSDEVISLFNLKSRREIGAITQYEGAITSLQFHDKYLFSSNTKGNIYIWSMKSWECLKTLQGHKDEVLCLSIHPSGKLGLSVSKDKTLKTWNLIDGRHAYTINIRQVSHLVLWSPEGTHFAVVLPNLVKIYKLETAEIVYPINTEKPVLALLFLKSNILAIGKEDGTIEIHDILSKNSVMSLHAHNSRVKGIYCMPSESNKNNLWLISISSDGYLKIWDINWTKNISKIVTEVNTTFRLTCVTAVNYKRSPLEIKKELEETESAEDISDSEIKSPKTPEAEVSRKNKVDTVPKKNKK